MVKVLIKCKECGKEFELRAKERDFFLSKNLALPKRCKPCRQKRKERSKKEVNK